MRIRSIKPEFWRSEDIAALDRDTRLLFIGLWSYVDDNGVGRDVEALIVADLFALDEPTESLAIVSRGLRKLSERGLIARYAVENRRFLHITKWESHQKIDHPNKPRYPPSTCDDAVFATISRDTREDLAPGAGEQGNRGTGDLNTPATATPRRKLDYPADFLLFWEQYPKKVSKDAALKAWRSAIKRATVDEIVEGARRYANNPTRERQYTKDPDGWLSAGKWADEAEPAKFVDPWQKQRMLG